MVYQIITYKNVLWGDKQSCTLCRALTEGYFQVFSPYSTRTMLKGRDDYYSMPKKGA